MGLLLVRRNRSHHSWQEQGIGPETHDQAANLEECLERQLQDQHSWPR